MLVTKENYSEYIFKLKGKYEKKSDCYIYDGEVNRYFYVLEYDNTYVKIVKITVINCENGRKSIRTYPLNNDLLSCIPIKNT